MLFIRRQARDWFARTVEFALECGGRHVSALPGVTSTASPKPESYERCCDELAWRCETASSHGVTFSVEAHVGSIVPTPESAARLVQSVPGLTLTLDYTHFTRSGVPDEEVEPLIAHASHFHARGAGRADCRHRSRKTSSTMDAFSTSCGRSGTRGTSGVEYVWIDWEHCNEVDNLSETILMRDYLRGHRSPA